MLSVILQRMTELSLALVLLSGLTHASWNLLLKNSHNQEVFIWWLKTTITILLVPVAVILIWNGGIENTGWWFILGTSLIHILYYLFLSRSYMHADLSLVYPLARGTGPILTAFLGITLLGETISQTALFGIMAVVSGIFAIYWWGQISQIFETPLTFLKNPGVRYALLTGLTISGYTVWDKVGVSYVNPLLYMYLLSLGTSAGLAPYMIWKYGTRVIKQELVSNKFRILVSACLLFGTYVTILNVLQFSKVSYVAPAREIGIVFSLLLGSIVLKESMGIGRIAGSLIITIGVFLIGIG